MSIGWRSAELKSCFFFIYLFSFAIEKMCRLSQALYLKSRL